MSRYKSSDKFFNEEDLYREFLDERGVSRLQQYRTQRWPALTDDLISSFGTFRRDWRIGDNYWKLAHEFYGDSRLWWVLAWFNRKPTEAHFKVGDYVLIPAPIEDILSLFNFGSR
jgi:hypothetical protein